MSIEKPPALPADISELLARAQAVEVPSASARETILSRVQETVSAPAAVASAEAPATTTVTPPVDEALKHSSLQRSKWAAGATVSVVVASALIFANFDEQTTDTDISAPQMDSVTASEARPDEGNEVRTGEQNTTGTDLSLAGPVAPSTATTPTQLPTQETAADPMVVTEPRTQDRDEIPQIRRKTAVDSVPTATQGERRPSERSLLERARRQFLSGRYSKALHILRRHQSLYRRGVLAEERDALRIRALISVGRRSEAERYGEKFLSRYPNSIHRSVIRDAFAQ